MILNNLLTYVEKGWPFDIDEFIENEDLTIQNLISWIKFWSPLDWNKESDQRTLKNIWDDLNRETKREQSKLILYKNPLFTNLEED